MKMGAVLFGNTESDEKRKRIEGRGEPSPSRSYRLNQGRRYLVGSKFMVQIRAQS